MTPFVFFKHRSSGEAGPNRPPSFEIELFDGRSPALDHGRGLLVRNADYSEVVVIEDDAEIARLRRP